MKKYRKLLFSKANYKFMKESVVELSDKDLSKDVKILNKYITIYVPLDGSEPIMKF